MKVTDQEHFANWLTGISPGKNPTFKDVLDNVKNFAALLAIAVGLNKYAEGVVYDPASQTIIAVSLAIFSVFLIMQAISLFVLSDFMTSEGDKSPARMICFGFVMIPVLCTLVLPIFLNIYQFSEK